MDIFPECSSLTTSTIHISLFMISGIVKRKKNLNTFLSSNHLLYHHRQGTNAWTTPRKLFRPLVRAQRFYLKTFTTCQTRTRFNRNFFSSSTSNRSKRKSLSEINLSYMSLCCVTHVGVSAQDTTLRYYMLNGSKD